MSTECKRVTNFDVIASGSILNDHLLLRIYCSCNIELVQMLNKPTVNDRWNHADVTPYYAATGYYSQDVLLNLDSFEVSFEHSPEGTIEFINATYDNMVNVLNSFARQFIPAHGHFFTHSGVRRKWIC